MPNEGFWVDGLQGTIDRLNAGLLQYGDIADRPAFGMKGRTYYAEDDEEEYYDTGFTWVKKGAAPAANFSRFTSSGTWPKPDEIILVYVEIIGGGASGVRDSQSNVIAFGGFPGYYLKKLFLATDLGSTEVITIGSGGTGGIGTGQSGSNSSFGDLIAPGGLNSIDGEYDSNTANATFLTRLGADVPGMGGGGSRKSSVKGMRGFPGVGLSLFTPLGSDGANNLIGTGSGGGGSRLNDVQAGDGGIPGGGGGSTGYNNAGSGGRGEVRIWSW